MSSTLRNKIIQPLDQEQEEKGLECANSRIFLEKALWVMLVTTARRTEGIPVGVIFTPVILGEERERETKSIKHHKPHQKIRCWLTSMWREKGSIE